jgi:hypothetical protein
VLEEGGEVIERFSGRKRLNFFLGQQLSVDDFRDEQEYHLQSRWLHNRLLHGTGVIDGLDIAIGGDASEPSVTVQPGVAIDPLGREIILGEPVQVALPPCEPSAVRLVAVEYLYRETDFAPRVHDGEKAATRIEDGVRLRLALGPCDDAVVIGRLLASESGWRADPGFTPARIGRGCAA